MPLRHVSSLAEKTKREVMKMKRILVVLAALVLVFAVACDGDNPAPSGDNGSSDDISSAPVVNTGTTHQELANFGSIGNSIIVSIFTNDSEIDSMMTKLASQSGSDGTGTVTNAANTLSFTGSLAGQMPIGKATMSNYVLDVTISGENQKIACTIWGTLTIEGESSTTMITAGMVADYVVKINSTNEVFSFNMNSKTGEAKVNGQAFSMTVDL